jgi:hypothetical protein
MKCSLEEARVFKNIENNYLISILGSVASLFQISIYMRIIQNKYPVNGKFLEYPGQGASTQRVIN